MDHSEELLHFNSVWRVSGELQLEFLDTFKHEINLTGLSGELNQVKVDLEAHGVLLIERLIQGPHSIDKVKSCYGRF